MLKPVLIDHDDSFTFILARYIEDACGVFPTVLNHRKTTHEEIKNLQPTHIILSPGPGNPTNHSDFAIGNEIISEFNLPILGVCLGHQGICAHFGAKITHAKRVLHGKKSLITHNNKGLFKNIPSPLTVMRYHSLAAINLPEELEVTAFADDGAIMAVKHKTRPIFGVQFHPESVGTEHGLKIIENFFAESLPGQTC